MRLTQNTHTHTQSKPGVSPGGAHSGPPERQPHTDTPHHAQQQRDTGLSARGKPTRGNRQSPEPSRRKWQRSSSNDNTAGDLVDDNEGSALGYPFITAVLSPVI